MNAKLSRHYYRKLNLREKIAYLIIYHSLSNLKHCVHLPFRCDAKTLHGTVEALLADNPQLFYLKGLYTYRTCNSGVLSLRKSEIEFDFSYDTRTIRLIAKKLDDVISRFPVLDDTAFARFVHDYLVKTVYYDVSDRGTCDTLHFENHNLVGALLRKKSVCDGISKAFAYIMRSRGIECAVIRGILLKNGGHSSENHGWNIIRLNGKNYHVDVTCDCTLSFGNPLLNRCDYFCLPDTEINKSHSFSDRFDCDSMDEYPFFKDRLTFDNIFSLEQYVESLPHDTKVFALKCNTLKPDEIHRSVIASLVKKRNSVLVKMYPNEELGVLYFEIL